jgi:putative Holliday junction resolvase
MRALGIDYGKKRVGIALSDSEGNIAFSNCVIENNVDFKTLSKKIFDICKENSVDTVVVGDSRNYKGEDNAIMNEVRKFVAEFKQVSGLEVVFEPEIMSSQEASTIHDMVSGNTAGTNRTIVKQNDIDATAAAIILQSYLNRVKYQIHRDAPKDDAGT